MKLLKKNLYFVLERDENEEKNEEIRNEDEEGFIPGFLFMMAVDCL